MFGGVLSQKVGFLQIDNCINYGSVKGDYSVGGMIGEYGGIQLTINNCKNFGLIQTIKPESTGKGEIGGQY
jgi:hypothetical protein